MTNKIIIFWGSKKDFEEYVASCIDDEEITIPFMELIQKYNARLRPNESGVRESELCQQIKVDNCIVRADDYGSVLSHVISNFSNIISLNHNIGTLFLNNPPRRVVDSLKTSYMEEIEEVNTDYVEINRELLKTVYCKLDKNILGQDTCKKSLIAGMYKVFNIKRKKPSVLMLYGPSGVGKTESAKIISKALGGELLRIQFSMMQTSEAYDYVFGSEHSKSCLAKDILGRESNVILIDEFDKVNPVFYNAFYELFDEGRYVDTNYDVSLDGCIILLTSNYTTEENIKNALGPAMFSRINCCIRYEELSRYNKQIIVKKWYDEVLSVLEEDEKEVIEKTNIKEWFINNVDRYDNIRSLKNRIENAVYNILTDKYIINV